MAPAVGTGERYATELGELWSGLARTLRQLDDVAAYPSELDDDDALDDLRRLQHHLHLFGERIFGLTPPAGAEASHAELADALAEARDTTGDVAAAVDGAGVRAAELLVHEWRGALFRVRLARLRLTAPDPLPAELEQEEELPGLKAPLIALCLVIAGAAAFVAGATVGPWPVWVAGMLAVCGSMLAYRP
ncbi:MAG TPA: hypothetical protein VG652_01270 [Gaiellaceae bacterium]|nr:hypothetical protein [Gaiellaceae bacterium]